jgi:hypothetical protein
MKRSGALSISYEVVEGINYFTWSGAGHYLFHIKWWTALTISLEAVQGIIYFTLSGVGHALFHTKCSWPCPSHLKTSRDTHKPANMVSKCPPLARLSRRSECKTFVAEPKHTPRLKILKRATFKLQHLPTTCTLLLPLWHHRHTCWSLVRQ